MKYTKFIHYSIISVIGVFFFITFLLISSPIFDYFTNGCSDSCAGCNYEPNIALKLIISAIISLGLNILLWNILLSIPIWIIDYMEARK